MMLMFISPYLGLFRGFLNKLMNSLSPPPYPTPLKPGGSVLPFAAPKSTITISTDL